MFPLNQLSCARLVLPPTCTSVCWAFCISLGVGPVGPRHTCCPSCTCSCPVPAAGAAPGWWWLLAFVYEHWTPLCPHPGMLRALTCHPCSGWLEGPSWELVACVGRGQLEGHLSWDRVCHPCVTYLAAVPISVSASIPCSPTHRRRVCRDVPAHPSVPSAG